ncbi:hypothetical protein [Halobacillus massiliensis]|uniref:hypothetical protein n=1 Tax=Halobacillus massiliensis TaxID=1926286 RepID=UPI0009E1F851|nr:hypothetical protein [Halobacillus massiliensis]
MVENVLTVVIIAGLIISNIITFKKRKKLGITGWRSLLTSICFSLIAIVQIIAYYSGFLGLISWMITMILLLLAAYFTKFLPKRESEA